MAGREGPYRRDYNSTNYTHPNEENINNLHRAMDYNNFGQPVVRTVNYNIFGQNNTTAFGELSVQETTPVIQQHFIYGIDPREVKAETLGDAEITTPDGILQLNSGTGPVTYSIVRSGEFLASRCGQGVISRFSVRFDQGIVGTQQRAGLLSFEEALCVGYNGTEFGVLHQHDKKNYIHKFVVTTAPSGSETVTITLDGVEYDITINATTINNGVAQLFSQFPRGLWAAEASDGEIYFVYFNNGNAPTTSDFSITSTGTLSGTSVTVRDADFGTETWIPQNSWNVDPLDGTGTSGIVIDPSKFNSFQISFHWLGSGTIQYAVESPTGDFIVFHQIPWTNLHTSLSLMNPSFSVGFFCVNQTGASGSSVNMYGGSYFGGIQGKVVQNKLPSSANNTITTNLTSNTVHHLGTLRNPLYYSGIINTSEFKLKKLSLAFQGNDPLELLVYINQPLATGSQVFNQYPGIKATASLVAGTISGTAMPAASYIIPINGNAIIDLSELNLIITPESTFTVGVRSGQTISRVTAGLIWVEE